MWLVKTKYSTKFVHTARDVCPSTATLAEGTRGTSCRRTLHYPIVRCSLRFYSFRQFPSRGTRTSTTAYCSAHHVSTGRGGGDGGRQRRGVRPLGAALDYLARGAWGTAHCRPQPPQHWHCWTLCQPQDYNVIELIEPSVFYYRKCVFTSELATELSTNVVPIFLNNNNFLCCFSTPLKLHLFLPFSPCFARNVPRLAIQIRSLCERESVKLLQKKGKSERVGKWQWF